MLKTWSSRLSRRNPERQCTAPVASWLALECPLLEAAENAGAHAPRPGRLLKQLQFATGNMPSECTLQLLWEIN